MSKKSSWDGNLIMNNIDKSVFNWLTKKTEELNDETYRLSRKDSGETRDSYITMVNQDNANTFTGYFGSGYKNSLFEEFGTGIYAMEDRGRKDGWVYYNEKEGKFFYTVGKTPNKPMRRAFSNKSRDLDKELGTIINEGLVGQLWDEDKPKSG